jgi:hydrogenase expression/formation protein HypC
LYQPGRDRTVLFKVQLNGGSAMCLAVPMRVLERQGYTARCEAKGVERGVSLFLLQDEAIEPGDYVAVHAGHAIAKISPDEAKIAWQLYDELLAAEDGKPA